MQARQWSGLAAWQGLLWHGQSCPVSVLTLGPCTLPALALQSCLPLALVSCLPLPFSPACPWSFSPGFLLSLSVSDTHQMPCVPCCKLWVCLTKRCATRTLLRPWVYWQIEIALAACHCLAQTNTVCTLSCSRPLCMLLHQDSRRSSSRSSRLCLGACCPSCCHPLTPACL